MQMVWSSHDWLPPKLRVQRALTRAVTDFTQDMIGKGFMTEEQLREVMRL